MKFLAIETAGERGSVALADDDGAITLRMLPPTGKHAETILAEIETLLNARGTSPTALDGVAFGEGPGGFTGLRIACGVTQGLAFARGLPVVGVGTLEATAQAADVDGRLDAVLVVIDARMDQQFAGAYQKTSVGWRVLSEPVLVDIGARFDLPKTPGADWTVVGDSRAADTARRLSLPYRAASADAAAVARLARPRFVGGDTVSAADALPVYVRNKVALTVVEQERLR